MLGKFFQPTMKNPSTSSFISTFWVIISSFILFIRIYTIIHSSPWFSIRIFNLPQPSRTGGRRVVGESCIGNIDWIRQGSGIGRQAESVFVELDVGQIERRTVVSQGRIGVFKSGAGNIGLAAGIQSHSSPIPLWRAN